MPQYQQAMRQQNTCQLTQNVQAQQLQSPSLPPALGQPVHSTPSSSLTPANLTEATGATSSTNAPPEYAGTIDEQTKAVVPKPSLSTIESAALTQLSPNNDQLGKRTTYIK